MILVGSDVLIAHLRGVPRAKEWLLRARRDTGRLSLMHTYRRSYSGIGLGNFLIAATVAVEGLQLATLNVRHFPMFRDLHASFDIHRPDDERQQTILIRSSRAGTSG